MAIDNDKKIISIQSNWQAVVRPRSSTGREKGIQGMQFKATKDIHTIMRLSNIERKNNLV
jgi:dUTPase